MLSEIVRVTRPGGRVDIVVRAIDMPFWVNLPLEPALKAKVDAPGIIGGGATKARARAARLAMRLRAPSLDAPTTGAIQKAVEPFAGDVIAKMVVICALLRAATRP
jgi:hypothetical protein